MRIKNKQKSFKELVRENKEALLGDKEALERIERDIEERYMSRK